MDSMMNIVRKPIIRRVPIMLNSEIYHVIASSSPNYTNSYLVATYSGDISTVRRQYHDAMDKWHTEHPGLWNFCIIPHSSITQFVRSEDLPSDVKEESSDENSD